MRCPFNESSILFAGLVVPLFFFAAASWATSPAVAADQGTRVKHGESIFQQRCIVCHSKQPGDTMPFGPPNLNGIFHGPSHLTTQQATAIIVNGKANMPAWGKILTRSDISDVIAYLRTK
jgi:mono/diheme cytochrome c family protein